MILARLLTHPLTRGLDLDSPATTVRRRQVVRDKPFLRRIYREWYTSLAAAVPAGEGDVLELGSGPGFLQEYIPGLITSDIMPLPGVLRVVDARRIDCAPASLRGIVMTNVLHHLPDVSQFFAEASRCVRPGGVIAMVEPWLSPWSRIIYRWLHHEPFVPDTIAWEFPGDGPLSDANGALPWIVFQRDRARFQRDFPGWAIRSITPCMPFRYLLSGGVSMRSFVPAFTYGFWKTCEAWLKPWINFWAMFAVIVLERVALQVEKSKACA